MEALFYLFCTTLPSHIIPFVLFWHFPWRSRTAALILVCLNVVCKMAVASIFLANGLNFRNTELVLVLLGFLIYCCFLRLDPFKMLFTYILIVDYLLIVRGIASFAAVHLLNAMPQGLESSLLCVLLYVVTLPLLRFFRRAANQVYQTDAPRLWRTIWLIPALLSLLTLLFTNSYLESSIESYFFIACRVSLLLCVFAIYLVLLQSLDGPAQQVALRQQLVFKSHMMELQMDEQKKHSHLIMEHEAQLRRQRHDLRHQLAAIQQMADTHPEQLKEFIFSLLDAIPAAPRTYCENPAVNAVVSHYAALCQEQGVDVQIRLDLPQRLDGVANGELCVIFGNLLENALEACGRMEQGRKFLRLDSQVHYDVLTITMDNSFDGPVRRESGVFRSSKRSELGVGLTSIQTVARKHQGNARFEPEDTVFRSSVYLRM